MKNKITIQELSTFLNNYLSIHQFKDYGPNGLQVEGKKAISKIAYAVSADLETIQEVVKLKADVLIVHHGLFWRGQEKTLTGAFGKRVKLLMQHDISLIGHHLPLDAHPKAGNAASIAKKINLTSLAPFGEPQKMPLGVKGVFKKPLSQEQLKEKLAAILQHEVLLAPPFNDPHKKIKSLGIITGGASGYWKLAKEQNLDAFLTGELREYDWYDAREADVALFAGGHSATEQFGVQELKKIIEEKYQVKGIYISNNNPA